MQPLVKKGASVCEAEVRARGCAQWLNIPALERPSIPNAAHFSAVPDLCYLRAITASRSPNTRWAISSRTVCGVSRLVASWDECLILVKALPHRSSNYFETVCCAGVGRDHAWRRLYPVPFRILQEGQKFGRWNWIKYQFTSPAHDGRKESQKVVPESISPTSTVRSEDRARIAASFTRESTDEAASRGETLTLIKPAEVRLSWKRKSDAELVAETRKHADLVRQSSMFDPSATPLRPCPYEFSFRWTCETGKTHVHACDDWETSTAFFRRRQAHGEIGALKSLRETYEGEYMKRGMRFALGTHSRRDTQWLLVGVIRVDDLSQPELPFGF